MAAGNGTKRTCVQNTALGFFAYREKSGMFAMKVDCICR